MVLRKHTWTRCATCSIGAICITAFRRTWSPSAARQSFPSLTPGRASLPVASSWTCPSCWECGSSKGGGAILPSHLEAWERAAGIKVESGDAVLIRTGRWSRADFEGDWQIMKRSAGLHASCLPWLKQRHVAVVGSDLVLDVLPSGVEGFEMPVHWVVIVAMGMPILDNCDFEALSEAAAARQLVLSADRCAVSRRRGNGFPHEPVGHVLIARCSRRRRLGHATAQLQLIAGRARCLQAARDRTVRTF